MFGAGFFIVSITFHNRLYQRNETSIRYSILYFIVLWRRKNPQKRETSTDKINVLGIITERADRYQWFQNGHNLIWRRRKNRHTHTNVTATKTKRAATDFVTLCICTHFWRSTFLLCPLHLLVFIRFLLSFYLFILFYFLLSCCSRLLMLMLSFIFPFSSFVRHKMWFSSFSFRSVFSLPFSISNRATQNTKCTKKKKKIVYKVVHHPLYIWNSLNHVVTLYTPWLVVVNIAQLARSLFRSFYPASRERARSSCAHSNINIKYYY